MFCVVDRQHRLAGLGARVESAADVVCAAAGSERAADPRPEVPLGIRTPADVPAPNARGGAGGVIAVGAVNVRDRLADFSGFGPVTWSATGPWRDHPLPAGLNKPDLVAPGVWINSTLRGGGYSGESWQGTSLATAHVSGTVALMLEHDPELRPAAVAQGLTDAALDLVLGNWSTVIDERTPRWISHTALPARGSDVPFRFRHGVWLPERISTCNALVARELLERLDASGPVFAPEFQRAGGEDEDFFIRAIRAGARCEFASDSIVKKECDEARIPFAASLRRAFHQGRTRM